MKKNPKTVAVFFEELLRSEFWKGLLAGAILVTLILISWRLALFIVGAAALYWLLRRPK